MATIFTPCERNLGSATRFFAACERRASAPMSIIVRFPPTVTIAARFRPPRPRWQMDCSNVCSLCLSIRE